MRSGEITGCCNGKNFYNLGGAHGHRTAKDQNEFNDWLAARESASVNIAVTNSEQRRTREFLEAAGWKTEKVNHLWVSTISGTDLRALNDRTHLRQVEERRTAMELKRKLEAERLAMRASQKFSPGIESKVYTGKIYRGDISRICQAHHPYNLRINNPGRIPEIQTVINDTYKIRIGDIRWMSMDVLRNQVYNKVYQARKAAGFL